jgi:type VI secretion system protein ImpA
MLRDLLGSARGVISDQLSRRGVGEAAPPVDVAAGAESPAGGEPASSGAAPAPAPPGEIHSREDVIRALDKACEYYNRHEPSSPIPLLLQRAKRLVSKSFMEIVKDLTPDGLTQIQNLSGVEGEEEWQEEGG